MESATGTLLNIRAPWRIVRENGSLSLRMEVTLLSYSLDVGDRPYGLVVTVDGTEYYYSTPAINYSGESQAASTLASVNVPVSSENPSVHISWNFAGSYSGTELPYIEASGTLG